ncbi:tRNA A37 threonylcarbamoyladenosine dehydratase [Alkalithermobacter thermoalcaliphilus JW-YL-7 = DSM 7308]|uniref:UBA/THIF-type NAD/FAD binding protein n=2 Tax=Clostridium paradoxum TaxID=29346 RepID=A0A150FS96_CLOPD|nr:UBA/THIF-type NAD/FAD binding protein [[Clostridium] paradoxum JW-YL-7 = DSM 7308]SHK73050.1 tRNA A37 threonylcarbamoyladenosine dehydratase [[Clostridium] paradoxum JW-YL-7 = DSM 7308]
MHEFIRTEMLIGTENLNKLKQSTVAVFGIGGVGTFVVEGLVRSGVEKLVLIDYDNICITNINRQIHATTKTVGRPKVEVMKERILEINPKAQVIAYKELYNSENASKLLSKEYTYVVDAIDMVSSKLDLIQRCKQMNIPIISSMGAGNKLNPTMLEVSDIYKTSVCPLARVMRYELRKRGIEKLKVVYSKETPITPKNMVNDPNRRQTPGSVSFVPSVAGLIIASEVVKDIINK